jgi:hypothetical protein
MTPELRKALKSLVDYYYSHNMSYAEWKDGEEMVTLLPARHEDMHVIRDELRKLEVLEKERV